MLAGSCLCGGVKYRATGPVLSLARCHCVQCRKASGTEFASNGSVAAAGFELVCGQELLRRYDKSWKTRSRSANEMEAYEAGEAASEHPTGWTGGLLFQPKAIDARPHSQSERQEKLCLPGTSNRPN
jgi:Glutathione-dependent formaldehyde-activating enzyme